MSELSAQTDQLGAGRPSRWVTRLSHVVTVGDLLLFTAACVVLANGIRARSSADAFTPGRWWLLAGGFAVLVTGLLTVGARSLGALAASRIDRRYDLTLAESVALIGRPEGQHPLVIRACALPAILIAPTLVIGLIVNQLGIKGDFLGYGSGLVGISTGIGALLWAYYGFPARALAFAAAWLASTILLIAGWPIASVVLGLPPAFAQLVLNQRLAARLIEQMHRR